jgi:hypothetical protein
MQGRPNSRGNVQLPPIRSWNIDAIQCDLMPCVRYLMH